jgi:iron-sulfur cluster repair protein YtfE (RIC family)
MIHELRELHDDHSALRPGVDAIRASADRVGHVSVPELRRTIAADRTFLLTEVLPHAGAEEDVLYPMLQRIMGSRSATVGMEHDHVQIRRYAHELGEIEAVIQGVEEIGGELARRMRRVLYGLYAILLVHFDKEDEMYTPHLRRALSEGEAGDLVERMEAAIAQHKSAMALA